MSFLTGKTTDTMKANENSTAHILPFDLEWVGTFCDSSATPRFLGIISSTCLCLLMNDDLLLGMPCNISFEVGGDGFT